MPDMEDPGVELFLNALVQQSQSLRGYFVAVATRLGIPYEHERETERVVNVRHEGKWVPIDDKGGGGTTWDSGKDHSHDNYPDSFNDVPGALAKIHRPVAMWYHNPSMNLVILDESGAKVGIRSTCLRIFLIGMHTGNVQALIEGLQEKLRAS